MTTAQDLYADGPTVLTRHNNDWSIIGHYHGHTLTYLLLHWTGIVPFEEALS